MSFFVYPLPLHLLHTLIWLKIASLAALQRSLEGVDSLWQAMRLIYTSRAHKFHQATLNNVARSTSESHPAPATAQPPPAAPPPSPGAAKRRQLNRLLPCRLARTLGPDIALVAAVDSIILMRLGDLLHWRRLAKADRRHTHTHSLHTPNWYFNRHFILSTSLAPSSRPCLGKWPKAAAGAATRPSSIPGSHTHL